MSRNQFNSKKIVFEERSGMVVIELNRDGLAALKSFVELRCRTKPLTLWDLSSMGGLKVYKKLKAEDVSWFVTASQWGFTCRKTLALENSDFKALALFAGIKLK